MPLLRSLGFGLGVVLQGWRTCRDGAHARRADTDEIATKEDKEHRRKSLVQSRKPAIRVPGEIVTPQFRRQARDFKTARFGQDGGLVKCGERTGGRQTKESR
jgi:hypothetical protein